jgi:hypothetical protein
MKLNQRCGIYAFLTKFCPDVVQALYLLPPLKLTLSIHQIDDMYVDLAYFISENVSFFTEVTASKH